MDYSKTQFQKIFGNKKVNLITYFEDFKKMKYLTRHLDFYQNFFMNSFGAEKVVEISVLENIAYYVFSSTKNVMGDNYLTVVDFENELFVVVMPQNNFQTVKQDIVAFVNNIKAFLLTSAEEIVAEETPAA